MLVPSAIFSELLGLSAAFRQFVFQAFGERLSELILLVESVALRRLDIRLAERLLQLAGEGRLKSVKPIRNWQLSWAPHAK
jgi:CRP/FNR family transcriptional regulator